MPASDPTVHLEEPRRTYARDHDAWRRVQPLLPPAFRVLGDEPAEQAWTWRGAQVHLDRYAVPDAPATVVVLHGAGGHGRLLSSAGRVIRDAGLEAVMPDLPGYGLTDAPHRLRTYDAWVALVADLVRAEAQRAGRPVVLLGMSVGGMLGWHAAASLPPGTLAAVAATTLIDPRDPVVREHVARWPRVGRASPGLLRAVRGPLRRVRMPVSSFARTDGMSNDPRVVAALLADRRGTGASVSLGFLRSWFGYVPPLEPEAWEHAPVLLAHPGDDRWTPTADSLRFFDRLPGPKRMVELENCGHLPMERPGLDVLTDAIDGLAAALRLDPHEAVRRLLADGR